MENKTYSQLSKICLGAALLGGFGSVIGISTLNESNSQEVNNYTMIGSAAIAYISFGLGLAGLYLGKDNHR